MRTKRRSRDRIGMVAAAALGMAWARGEPKTRAQEVPLPAAAAAGSGVGEAVDRLAEGLKTAPLLRPAGSDRFRLFVVDVETGDAAPIVDEPEKGRSRCGTPSWSPDGRRILFDAAPLDLRQLSRVESLDLAAGAPRIADLGSGRFPCFSPDGNRIAFSLMPRAGGGDAPGVWSMRADGSGRRWLGVQGRPRWSPDGRRLLVVDPGASRPAWMMDPDGGGLRTVELAGRRIFQTPAWESADTLVAAVGRDSADAVALIDVSDPGGASVKEVLWRRTDGADPEPGEVAYCRETGRCVFVGTGPRGMALYTLKRGDPAPLRRLEPGGFDSNLGDLAFSPGGRYLLFHTDNPDRARGRPARAGSPVPVVGDPAAEAARLVASLDRDPVLRPGGSDRHRVFLMELPGGRSRPVLDEPGRRLSFCGSLSWSGDGRRILLDASPVGLFQVAHIKSVELADGRPALIEQKAGNCPSLSPDGRRIAYLANAGGDSTEEPGVWVMGADGSDPRRMNLYGSPHWSPDGRRILVAGFGVPLDASILDPATGESRRVRVRGRTLVAVPEWGGDDVVVAVLTAGPTVEIVLLDVSSPEAAAVKEVLWEGSAGDGPAPSDVVFDPRAGRCVFAAAEAGGMRLYIVERGKPGSPTRLDAEGPDPMIADLALSPDGRYLLFRSNNPDRGRAELARPRAAERSSGP